MRPPPVHPRALRRDGTAMDTLGPRRLPRRHRTHGKAHFARAILEGTSHAMRDVIDRLTDLGLDTPPACA